MDSKVEMIVPVMSGIEIIVANTAESIAKQMQFDQQKTDEISIAVIEAIINSIEHGKDLNGKIRVVFSVQAHEISISIIDQGIGFDPSSIEKPNIHSKLSGGRKRGWGLELIRKNMDRFDIISGENGTTFMMTKKK